MTDRRSGSWRRGGAVAMAASIGGLNVASGLGVGRRVEGASWFPAPQSSPTAMVVLGVALVLVAQGLRRRHLAAWVLGAGFFVVSALATARGPHAALVVCLCGVVLFGLAHEPRMVVVPAERVELVVRGAAVVIAALVAVGTGALLVGGGRLEPRPSVSEALRAVAHRLVGTATDLQGTGLIDLVERVLPLASGVVALVLLLVLLQPLPDDSPDDERLRDHVRELCVGPGGDAMAPFNRRRDRRYVLSPDGHAVVGYRVVFGVCLAGPGPAGDADSHDAAIAAWVRRCDEHGWFPAMIGASDRTRASARSFAMHGLRIGDDVSVPVGPFDLAQPSMRNVRQAAKRTRNSGVTVTVHREVDLDEAERAALGAVLVEWQRGRGEKGFSMTLDRMLEGAYPDALVFAAAHDGAPVGFQRYVPCRDGRTLSLDVMPRSRHAPNGVNERLIVEAVQWGAQHGVEDVSLNFAAFRTVFEGEPSITNRALRRVVHLLDRFINVESLYRFNAKFQPIWSPRHVLFRSPLDLPWLLVAALKAEFSGGAADVTTVVADVATGHEAANDPLGKPAPRS